MLKEKINENMIDSIEKAEKPSKNYMNAYRTLYKDQL